MKRTAVQATGRAALVAAWLAGAPGAQAQAVSPGAPADPGVEIYRADVTVEDTIVNEDGEVVETRPATRFRLTRRRVPAGIETEIAYPEAKLHARGPLTDPRGGSRYVFTPGAPSRIYDASGALVASLDDARDDADADDRRVVFADRDRRTREARLRTRLGRPAGRQGTRDRYVAGDGDLVTETLVEPSSMLPVEINVVRGGTLEHRTWHAYGRMPGGRWYLATTRSESALADGSGRRLVSTRTHTNVAGTEGR